MKADGAIAWLKANNGFYRFGVQKIGPMQKFAATEDRATLEVLATEDQTLYLNGKIDPSQTDCTTGLVRYQLERVNGQWKIANYQTVPGSTAARPLPTAASS